MVNYIGSLVCFFFFALLALVLCKPPAFLHTEFWVALSSQRLQRFSESHSWTELVAIHDWTLPLVAAAPKCWEMRCTFQLISAQEWTAVPKSDLLPEVHRSCRLGSQTYSIFTACVVPWLCCMRFGHIDVIPAVPWFRMGCLQRRISSPETAERDVYGKSCIRLPIWDLLYVWSRALLHMGFVLLTFRSHPDQTYQGKSWLYFKSHYSSSVFHHPADTLFAAASLLAAGGIAVKPSTADRKRRVLPSNTGLPSTSLLLHYHGAQPT